jgi:two-component system response regulator AtoC
VVEAITAAEGLRVAHEALPALVLLDWRLPDQDGFHTLEQLKAQYPAVEVIMLTAYGSPQMAVRAIKSGALDFVPKSGDLEDLLVAVRSALETIRQREDQARLTAEQYRGLILGKSRAIQEIHEHIHTAARSTVPVLITGETGTGKELVARAITMGSERHGQPFVTVDCTTLSRELLESELFGHERGAFTGAHRQKPGRVELADHGTLFLDEIGELDPVLQSKLLGVLERKEFFRVGGTAPVRVDVRIIAATNRDLRQEVQANRFRADLFYRLLVLHIHLPPLRERREDIPILTEHFLSRVAQELRKPLVGVTDEVLECFLAYPWPGNVRELSNTIQRMAIFERGSRLSLAVLPQELRSALTGSTLTPDPPQAEATPTNLSLEEATAQFRRQFIERVLRAHQGNVSAAAQALKINRTHLYKLLKQLGFSVDRPTHQA